MKNLNVKINIKDTFLWDDPDFIKAYLDLVLLQNLEQLHNFLWIGNGLGQGSTGSLKR